MMKLMRKTLQYPLDEVSVSRRNLLKYALTSALASSMIGKAMAETSPPTKAANALSIENFSVAGKSEGVVRVAQVVKTEAEWRKQLIGLAFNVTPMKVLRRHLLANTGTTMQKAFIVAFAVIPHCLMQKPSLNLAQVGQVFGNLYRL